MSDFDELYQEIILDHYRRPRGAAHLDDVPDEDAHENPTCGDSLKLKVELGPDGRIARVLHESRGCAISVASASMLSTAVAGLEPAQALSLAARVEAALRGEGDDPRGFLEEQGELGALAGVAAFPARVKCASLSWRALESALAPRPTGGRRGPGVQEPVDSPETGRPK